jgi:hypothetical protein
MMEVVDFSETKIYLYQTSRVHIPEDYNISPQISQITPDSESPLVMVSPNLQNSETVSVLVKWISLF